LVVGLGLGRQQLDRRRERGQMRVRRDRTRDWLRTNCD
jgi:hypothetical protein